MTTSIVLKRGFVPAAWAAPAGAPDALGGMLNGIDSVVRSAGPAPERRVADILARYAALPDLLDRLVLKAPQHGVARLLLEDGPAHCVFAIAWAPGRMCPLREHRSWSAFAVQRGSLVESAFRHEAGRLVMTGARTLRDGDAGFAAPRTTATRLANVGAAPALSLHVYGVPAARLADSLPKVFAAA